MRLFQRPAAWILSVLVTTFVGSGCPRMGAESPRSTEKRAQQTAGATPAELDATRKKMTAFRDQFVSELRADGFTCPIAPPTIVVEDVPSFGNYNDATNILRTADWALLNPRERGFVAHLAGPGASESMVQRAFETAAHEWIFVHELGHWWQACQGVRTANHYAIESGANRVALAYWREKDPQVVTTMMGMFHQVLDQVSSPVPTGETVESYFNKNYETLGPGPSYPWFQSRMNVQLDQEKPKPSFKTVLADTR